MWIVGNNNNNHNDSIRHRKTYIESLGGGRLGLNKFMFCTFSRKKVIFNFSNLLFPPKNKLILLIFGLSYE